MVESDIGQTNRQIQELNIQEYEREAHMVEKEKEIPEETKALRKVEIYVCNEASF